MARQIIQTSEAPAAVGPYSQAVKCGNTVYLSGQVALDPVTQQMNAETVEMEVRQVFANLAALARAAGGTLDHAVKVNVFLTDLAHWPLVNQVMTELFQKPYPARAAIGVAALPKGARVEADAILVLE